MKLDISVSPLRTAAFRAWRALVVHVPGGRVRAFGEGEGQISAVVVINLDRQPERWRRVTRELKRFRTSEGAPLMSIVRRLPAVDARDGLAVAATADVDVMYRIGDQLYVQPDPRLARCFAESEPVRMTPQEVAVARSHVEVWKVVATGTDDFVLVLEDDVWFRPGAAAAIDQGWRTAQFRHATEGGPKLLYLSYSDAGGTAERVDAGGGVFQPVRGLWFLSGYVLSREGARALLRAMPVIGPVDLWMNFRFAELHTLALGSPAIAQRRDEVSANAYSVLPYLARAGIVDAENHPKPPDVVRAGRVLAWTGPGERESLPMALSMLGLRVRAFDGDEEPMDEEALRTALRTFDALVDPPVMDSALAAAAADEGFLIFLEADAPIPAGLDRSRLPSSRFAILERDEFGRGSWGVLCEVLDLLAPAEAYPVGPPGSNRLFRDDRPVSTLAFASRPNIHSLDDSPWVLPSSSGWGATHNLGTSVHRDALTLVEASMTGYSSEFRALVETFPGNLASFTREGVRHTREGAQLTLAVSKSQRRPRRYRSGAFASLRSFSYGRFQAEIRAAPGSGLVTGFFLHRDSPRQEIDVELAGSNPRIMIANVYFNPGDEGATMSYGYRGSPWRIDLGFDATEDFHIYAIDWRSHRLAWLVDGAVVHERVGWDPTPIPHLPMRFHGNLWAPRSEELAGRIDERALPATAAFKNVSVTADKASERLGMTSSTAVRAEGLLLHP